VLCWQTRVIRKHDSRERIDYSRTTGKVTVVSGDEQGNHHASIAFVGRKIYYEAKNAQVGIVRGQMFTNVSFILSRTTDIFVLITRSKLPI